MKKVALLALLYLLATPLVTRAGINGEVAGRVAGRAAAACFTGGMLVWLIQGNFFKIGYAPCVIGAVYLRVLATSANEADASAYPTEADLQRMQSEDQDPANSLNPEE